MPPYPHTIKHRAESALVDSRFDFIAKYHAVTDLRRLAQKQPGVLDEQTIESVETLLRSDQFCRIRQSYFLYREAASVMTDMASVPGGNGMGPKALASLERLLRQTRGNAHRGVAEALGSLPLKISGPQIPVGSVSSPPAISWEDLIRISGQTCDGDLRYFGRSLVVETADSNRLLVVKLAKKEDAAEDLRKEIHWMGTLKQPGYAVDRRFHIPDPIRVQDRSVFRISHLPLPPPDTVSRHPQGLAIAFVVPREYFVYPNQHRISGEAAREMLGRNAFLMGWLAAKGVVHDAPIPLFHNRTQRLRRDDRGRYQWFRAGRLDQWLDSCVFPNLGLTGLRDFEHLESVTGGSQLLYRSIGSHFLSLMLVAGSYFRARDRSRKGVDENGKPMDVRDLFERPLLLAMVREIFENYYTGFTGRPAPAALPVDQDNLVDRMIEEMGVDRYMTELLRRVDQVQMTDRQFHDFLMSKGYSEDALVGMRRGKADIHITSGPHLGDFNRQISLPELIECVAAMSAVCMAGRFMAMQ